MDGLSRRDAVSTLLEIQPQAGYGSLREFYQQVVFQPFLRFNRAIIKFYAEHAPCLFQPFLRFNKAIEWCMKLEDEIVFQPFLRFNADSLRNLRQPVQRFNPS